MIIKTATCLALVGACLAATVSAASAQTDGLTVEVMPPPRVDPADVNWNPQRNVVEAQRYDRLLETSPAFRIARIQKKRLDQRSRMNHLLHDERHQVRQDQRIVHVRRATEGRVSTDGDKHDSGQWPVAGGQLMPHTGH